MNFEIYRIMKLSTNNLLFICLLVSLGFSSCNRKLLNSELSNINGKYVWKSIYGVGATLELSEDNRFEYNWQQGLISGKTTGTWILKNNKIILNSDQQPKVKSNSEVKYLPRKNIIGIELNIVDKEDTPLKFVNCTHYRDCIFIDGCSTDSIGQCIIKEFERNGKLSISYLGYEEFEFQINNLESNCLLITIDEEEEYYEYFTNRNWIIKRGKIYRPEIEKDKFTNNYFDKLK